MSNTKNLTKDINKEFSDPLEAIKLGGWDRLSEEDIVGAQPLVTRQKFEDYEKYIPGKIDPVFGDIDETRAQNQTGAQLWSKAIGQGVIEATMGAVEGIGYALDFEELFNADIQAQEGFDNWFSNGIRQAKEYLQEELLPIYQTRTAQEGSFLDRMGDATFWASQGKTVGTTLSLLAPSLGVANIAGKLGKVIKLGEGATGVLQGMSAAAFSRKAESAMEANQAFSQEYDKYIQEGLSDTEARLKAGESAATVFKANAAMLPMDMLQYTLALKSFKGLKSGLDAVKATKAGKIVENLIIQPGSEALEEAYQFVAQQEATKQVREGITPFGDGFGSRLSDYVEDPEFQTAAFLGAAMGGLFGAMAPISRKVAKVNDDFMAKKLATSNLGDIDAFTKIDNKIKGNIIVKNLVSDRLDSVVEQLNSIEDSLQDNEKYSDEEKKDLLTKLNSFKEDIEYVKKADETLKNSDPKYAENPKLRNKYTTLKWEDKLNNERIKELEGVKGKLLNDFVDSRDNAVFQDRKIKILETKFSEIKKDKKISPETKEKITKEYEEEIELSKKKLDSLVEEAKLIDKNFNVKEYSSPNIEELQKVSGELYAAQVHKATTLRPQMAQIERMSIEEGTKEEEAIQKRTEEKVVKLVKETEKEDKLAEKKVIEEETKEITTTLDNAKTVDEVLAVEQQIINSTSLTDKNKQAVLQKTKQKKAEIEEVEASKLTFTKQGEPVSGAKSTSFGFEETIPKEGEVVPEVKEQPSGSTKQQSQTAESRETPTREDETEYEEPTRQTKEKLKEVVEVENEVIPSTKKTQITNIAHKDIVQNPDGSTKLDKEGNILVEENADLTLSLPTTFTPGTEIVMFIDTLNPVYEANKDNSDRIPIAIQSKEDYGKKAPTIFLHDMEWITPKKVVEEDIERVKKETKAIRDYMFKNKQPILNFTTSKSMGWVNRTNKQRTLREIIGTDTRPVLGFGTRTGSIWNVGGKETINNKFVSGIPYLLLPTANDSYFAVWLGQKEISKTPELQTKYNNTVVSILESYAKRDKIAPKTIKELRAAISPYYHVNTDKLTEETISFADKRLIFHINEREVEGKQTLYLQLSADKKLERRGFQDYRFFNGQWEKHNGKEFVLVENMVNELKEKLADKYANITKQGITSGKNFEVYELVDGTLTKVKKDYIDFLSDNKVVTHSTQALDVNGTNVYFAQPNIGINTDISELKPLEQKKGKEKALESLEKSEKSVTFEELTKPFENIMDEFSKEDLETAEKIMKHCKTI